MPHTLNALRNKHRWWILITALLLVAATSIYLSRMRSSFTEIHPKTGPVTEAIYGLGKVKASNVFEYKLGVAMGIRKLHVSEGDQVNAGTPLLDFDDGRRLTAPFAGTITALPYHERENVFPQAVILRLENLKKRYVEIAIEQQGVLRLKPGQTASLSFESLRGQHFRGTVEKVYPSADEFLIRVNTENLPDTILPGMTADVAITVGQKEKALLIPLNSLNNGKITRIREGKKAKISVEAGTSDGEWIEVISGDLRESDLVVIPRKN